MASRPRFSALAALVLVGTTALTACGGDHDSSTSGGSSESGSRGTGSSSQAALDAAYEGVVGTPPTEAASAPADGGTVWVVSCGQSVPTCATPSQGAADAAEAAGFAASVCDGKLNPQGWSDCIRQGIAAKAVGIIVIGQDCASFQAALQEAKDAGVPTIGAGGNDCDVVGGPNLFSAVVQNLPDTTQQDWWAQIGKLQADWIIGKTDGKASVLSLKFTDSIWGGWVQDGFETELKTCSGCSIASTLELSNQDLVSGALAQKVSTALLKTPQANSVNLPIDGWMFAGLSQAIQSSGRSDTLNVIGAFGEPGNLDLIRENGGEDATVGYALSWTAWSGVDALIRVLDGAEPQPAGVGLQTIDADNNMPEAGQPFSYSPSIDYAAAYTKLWTAS
jgi:ribose transport system substrate-binding protein